MADQFKPYWLLHEPGKTHGFATVEGHRADTAEEAVEVWIEDNPAWVAMYGRAEWEGKQARLITEPIIPQEAA